MLKKKKYIRPIIFLEKVQLEGGVCAGSAVVRPQNQDNEVIHEWEVIDEPTRNIDW